MPFGSTQNYVVFLSRLSAVERKKIARERKLSARSNTVKAYEGSLKRFDWFLEHDDQGNKRAKPYNGNMVTAKNGVDVAVRFIQWVGQNFPGHEWPKKASELKLKVLEAMHSGLQSRYSEQLMALRAEQRSQGVASSSAFSPAARLRWMPACRRAGAICEERPSPKGQRSNLRGPARPRGRPVTSKGSQEKAKVKSTAPVSPPAVLAPTHTAVGRTPRPLRPDGRRFGSTHRLAATRKRSRQKPGS
ncbi:g11861 [Coccomyxa elongata]